MRRKAQQRKTYHEQQLKKEYIPNLVRGGFQPRLPTSLPPPGQQQQPSPLPRRQPVPLMPPAQLHPGAPQVVAPAPAVPLKSPPPSELMDVDPSAGPPSQAVAVQPVLQPLSLGAPKESDTAAPCPAPTQQPSTQRQETLPLLVGPDALSRPVPEAAPVVTDFNSGKNIFKLEMHQSVSQYGPEIHEAVASTTPGKTAVTAATAAIAIDLITAANNSTIHQKQDTFEILPFPLFLYGVNDWEMYLWFLSHYFSAYKVTDSDQK
ncbi:SH3 domain-binding protein 1-like [Schistocerca americana]|uniref:SH3 domain-binding protein 1-like n=1 Tax=Schistocerca americana TaxID=7009 RepID=UPI001F500880|nr:SH3 domain-binding protein 1-like [Schistocerca americana]